MYCTPDEDPVSTKKFREGEKPGIMFSDDDFAGIELPHNDALVVRAQIANREVRRVLIDPGSSTDVIYKGLYEKIKDHVKLEDIGHPVYSFTGQPIWPLGIVKLDVKLGPKSVPVDFVVVDVETNTFNAILGRSWIGSMKAVPSTLHQKVKYMIPGGVVTIRGSQRDARITFKESIQFTLTEDPPRSLQGVDEQLAEAAQHNFALIQGDSTPPLGDCQAKDVAFPIHETEGVASPIHTAELPAKKAKKVKTKNKAPAEVKAPSEEKVGNPKKSKAPRKKRKKPEEVTTKRPRL